MYVCMYVCMYRGEGEGKGLRELSDVRFSTFCVLYVLCSVWWRPVFGVVVVVVEWGERGWDRD